MSFSRGKFCQTQKEAYDHARAALKFMAEHSQKYLDELRSKAQIVNR